MKKLKILKKIHKIQQFIDHHIKIIIKNISKYFAENLNLYLTSLKFHQNNHRISQKLVLSIHTQFHSIQFASN